MPAEALYDVITRELPLLQQVSEEQSLEVLRPGGWTRKQELGHLIDSASNNHVRIVGAATRGEFRGGTYDQDGWVRLHAYNDLPWSSLVQFWFRYNALIVQALRNTPPERLMAICVIGESEMALRGLVEDYTLHMQHHLDQILKREKITAYPSAAAAQAR